MTNEDRHCLFSRGPQPHGQRCENPYAPTAYERTWQDVELGNLTFIKYGGDPWRQGILPEPYRVHAFEETAELLHMRNATLPPRFCCCMHDSRWCLVDTSFPGWAVAFLVTGGVGLLVALLAWGYTRVHGAPQVQGTEKEPLHK